MSRQQDVLDATANGESYRAEDLLTDEDIRRVTGYTVLERNPGSVMGIYSNGCTWVLDTGRPGMNPEIVLGTKSDNGRSFFDSFLSIGGAAPVADLGDTAIRNSPVDITAVKGDVLVDIQYLEFPQPKSDIARQLAEAVFARLP